MSPTDVAGTATAETGGTDVEAELAASWTDLGMAVLSAAVIFVAVITYTRLAGLRSFSKMSSFDFASTVAIGSTMASVGMGQSSLLVGLAVLAAFYGMQVVVALLRRRSNINALVDNEPLLLMAGNRILHDHLAATRVTVDDVKSKLREANVGTYDQVHAVVLETTGDISVLHGGPPPDLDLFSGVRGADLLA